jgi:3-deoxy-D-manno-octulosonate 8-phosphate phosphatase KdsC-like HAD superfamily phosphatase
MLMAAAALAALLAPPRLVAEPGGDNPQATEILQKYLAATEGSRAKAVGLTMDAEFDAKIVRLNKQGRLFALRQISNLGRVTYNALRFVGDDTVKKEVIARYLKAEEEAAAKAPTVALTPENYKFKYKGLVVRDGKRVHVFEVRPHKKQVGLFKGELWVDPDTYLAVRESGVLVKNPSIFLKKVEFVRNYQIQDGMALLASLDSTIDTRIVGRTELHVNYSDYRRVETASQTSASLDNQ